MGEDRFQEAADLLQTTIRLDRNNVEACSLHANCMTALGRFDEAWQQYERVLELNPDNLRSYYQMVRLRKLSTADSPLLDRMRAAAAKNPPDSMGVFVHLALGKALDDIGDYQAAMQAYNSASTLRQRLGRMDRAALSAAFDWLIGAFPQERPSGSAAAHAAERRPVFVLGMPRSGTTLIEQILSSHSQVVGAGELPFWNERGSELLARKPTGRLDTFANQAASDYLRNLDELAPEAARVVDKMPSNVMWSGLIHLAFPRATIFHCRRHPIDTCLSIYSTHFFGANPFTPRSKSDLVFYYQQYIRLMRHWQTVMPAEQLIDVDYEALVHDAEPRIRRLIAQCGLDWEDACLTPERNRRAVRTASMWQVRQPIYRHAAERWRRYEPWLGALRQLEELTA